MPSASDPLESAPLAAVAEFSDEGIIGKDLNGTITGWNKGAERIFGYTSEEIIGSSVSRLIPKDRAEEGDAILEKLRRGESVHHLETLRRRKDGKLIEVAVTASPVRDAAGHVIGVAKVASDISEKKRIQRELARATALLERTGELAKVGGWELDLRTMQLSWTRETFRIAEVDSGIEPTFAMGIDHYEPEARPVIAAAIQAATAHGTPYDLELPFVTAKGRRIWVRTQGFATMEDGRAVVLSGTFQDITARKQEEQARLHLDRRMQETQKLESLGVLAGGIAHDFNNLLTSILGNASLAALELPAPSPIQENLRAIEQGALRAAELCRQMLAYSGKGRFSISQLSLTDLVHDTVPLLKLAVSKQAVLRFHLDAGLPAIAADAAQLRQVLMNLVINASEAIGARSGVISVGTGLTRVDRGYLGGTLHAPELPEGNYVHLEVADNGCGMSPETRDRIFDPFFSTKFDGRGLGLAAVLGIVRGHHGALKVESAPGRGSTFRLLFPTAPEPADSAGAGPAAGSGGWRGQGCVLVVDDEESVRSTVATMLRKIGFAVALAADGRQGLASFCENPERYALVLLDLTMPHLDGEAAFAAMRAIRPDAAIVLMSGFTEEEAIRRFTGKGLAGFIHKPFTFEGLGETVRRALARPAAEAG
jgi:PAS domain S-box-containing protein